MFNFRKSVNSAILISQLGLHLRDINMTARLPVLE
jgi:hypothetical protein